MNLVLPFFAAVLPSQGFRYVATFFPDAENGLPVHKDFAPGDVDDMIGYAKWCVSKSAQVYFGVGGYLPGPDGKMRRTAACSRWHRCLRLDLDVGDPAEGKHVDKRSAITALQQLVDAHSLPKPWLVDSGYGIHVYWAFDQDIALEQWLPLANRLKSACMALGFQTDNTTTTDAARILRFPDTLNRKLTDAVPVRILLQGETAPVSRFDTLPAAMGHIAVPTVGQPRAAASELQQNLHPPYFLRGVLTKCPGMGAMVMDKGAKAREPLWKSVLDLVHQSADEPAVQERTARHLSMGHAGFSEGGFATKWAQTQQQNYQPPTCERMAAAGMPECVGCPLRGSIVSPVVLGRPMAVLPEYQAPGSPAAPPPAATPPPTASLSSAQQATGTPTVMGVFVITPGIGPAQVIDGQLTKDLAISQGYPCTRVELKDDDGNPRDWWRPICRYRIVEVERLLDQRGQQAITAITFDRHADKLLRVEFSHGDLSEPRAFNSKLGAAGLHMPRKDAAYLQDTFMAEFLQQLQRLRSANKIASHCGWTDERDGFVLGTCLYTAAGVEHIRPNAGSASEMEAYHIEGDEQAWRTAFDLCLGGGADRQAVLALSIAAPLMQFSGVDGLLLNAYSKASGVGKSTLCDAALSIWGSPNLLRKDWRDTPNATFKLASICGNLPMVVDEFTNVEGKVLSDYVYTITQGREKHRLRADSALNTGGSRWCLPTITTSNNSVHEKLQDFRSDAVAEAARVFELQLSPLVSSPEQLQHNKLALQALRTSYGFLGPRLIPLYMQRSPAQWQQMLSDRIAYWDREMAQGATDRFRSACAALCEIGAAVGKTLGLAFDPTEVRAVLRSQWVSQQTQFDAQTKGPEDVLNGYIIDHLQDFAVLGGQQADALVSAMPRRFFGEIRGRNINNKFTAEHVMMPIEMLRDHCRERNVSFRTLQEWLQMQLLDPNGCVSRMGKLVFLQGLMQQVSTPAVEFKASLLGIPALSVVPTDTSTNVVGRIGHG